MRITEALLDHDQHGPWADIAKRCARRYKQTTGRQFDGELLTHAAHMDRRPAELADHVAWGFARRAVRQMRAACSVCGSPAKQRRGEYRGVYLCASCHLPYGFQNQLHWLLRAQDEGSGVARSVLGEHQLPPLVRQAIPPDKWRAMALPDRSQMRYLTDHDIEGLTVWLLRLCFVLERVSGERACSRIEFAASKSTQEVEVAEAA